MLNTSMYILLQAEACRAVGHSYLSKPGSDRTFFLFSDGRKASIFV